MTQILKTIGRLQYRQRRLSKALPVQWLMTDVRRMPDPLSVVKRLPRGSGIIVRHTDPKELRALAERLMPACRDRGLVCLIAGDWRIAARVRAHGVHLPERLARGGLMASTLLWRRNTGSFLTVAAHGPMAMNRARPLKADGILLAPVFTTVSHPEARPLGTARFAMLVRQAGGPVIALGGITARTINAVMACGAKGIAGISWADD